MTEGDIATSEDLADPNWRGRICTRSGTHPYNLALVSAAIAHHGEGAARTCAEGVKANLARKTQGNDRAQVKANWAEECDISLGDTYSMGLILADAEQTEWANSVHIVFPAFEKGSPHMNISGVAMTAAAPHRADALAILEFLVSPWAQAIYAGVNHKFPVKSDALRSDLVASWGDFTPDSIDLKALLALCGTMHRKLWKLSTSTVEDITCGLSLRSCALFPKDSVAGQNKIPNRPFSSARRSNRKTQSHPNNLLCTSRSDIKSAEMAFGSVAFRCFSMRSRFRFSLL